MAQEDDLRALGKIADFSRAGGFFLLFFNLYWFCYIFFESNGWSASMSDSLLMDLSKTGLFEDPLYTKLGSLILLILSCMGIKGKKSEEMNWTQIIIVGGIGMVLFFFNDLYNYADLSSLSVVIYTLTMLIGYVCLMVAAIWATRLLNIDLMEDSFNVENESFMQETKLMENEYSVNIPTKFWYKKKEHTGWINIVNPHRATLVLGTPGSGKSFAIVNSFIKQMIEKGNAMYIYDFKYPDLTEIAYNHLLNNSDGYTVKPKFYVINFDDPSKSHRSNPLNPLFMTDIADAYESAYTIMLNLNRSWIQKQGDFFVESPIILFAAIIWFLRIYEDGKYCTFPHAIEFLNKKYTEIFPVLTSYPELENYLSPFMDAWEGGAQDQLQGQIASAKIPLSRMISPQLYWVMSGDDFTLDLNNPKEPKILCVGNNPDRQNIYSAALGLYNSRIIKLINKKGRLKCAVIIDELATIYFRGLDQLIATARSNKVAICLALQDFAQLIRDYGDKEAKVILNTIGNILSGQVIGETAKSLSERFGKVLQRRQSLSINKQDTSTSISTQLDSLIPASKIANLSQGMFVGSVADNFDERIEQKIFNAEIVIDVDKVKAETAKYVKMPTIIDFGGATEEEKKENMKKKIQENYDQIKMDINMLVKSEYERVMQEKAETEAAEEAARKVAEDDTSEVNVIEENWLP